jgi:predicted Zn-dependent peptidase
VPYRPAAAILPLFLLVLPVLAAPSAVRPEVPVEEFELPNGMRFLLVRRPGAPMVAAGWAVRTGSGDERPGRTGISHLLEHLMFHGSQRIGTRDARREGVLMARQDEVRDRLDALRTRPSSPDVETEIAGLERRLEELRQEHGKLILRGELQRIYQTAGAVGTNAVTDRDFTAFYSQIPAHKLELWFWMESDRLLAPVFRELDREGQVVVEERRQRLESTPMGPLLERLAEVVWEGHSYAWPTLGRPDDLAAIRRADVDAWFAAHYRPERITAVLVGDFDPEEVKALARAYFGRLARTGSAPAAEPAKPAPVQAAERRRTETCDCAPQARVLYRTPAFGHSDTYALDVLAGLLNGRTGRLYRSLVVDRQVAFSAFALHGPQRRGGTFGVTLESKGEVKPADLVAAWEAELERIRTGPIPDRELEKVKNQITTDAWRRISDPLELALRLLSYDAQGGWQQINRWPEATLKVTAEDVRRVAAAYLKPELRTVGIFERGERKAK